MSASPAGAKSSFTAVKWLICIISSIGFAFDIYVLLVLPLIIRPALQELGGFQPGTPEFSKWLGLLFYVPAVAGGIIGLIGGYLTDKLGRRRILTWSILLYAISTFASGYATSLTMLLVLRCLTFIGVCVEFVAAIAWIAELFEDRDQRERALGYTQAFSSFGGLLVAVTGGLCFKYGESFPAIELPHFLSFLGSIAEPHAGWRYLLMSGFLPALPLIVIRPFLPESPAWQAKKTAGTLKRPSFGELFAPQFRLTTIVTTIMFACSYGAAFGAIQQIPQIVPRFTDVFQKTQKLRQEEQGKPPAKVKELEAQAKRIEAAAAPNYQMSQEIGGLIGRFLLAVLAVRIISRRGLLRVFQLPGLLLMPLIFWHMGTHGNHTLFHVGAYEITAMHLGIFLCGFFTVAQFSFWGNYLPYAYPLHMRGTGESFAANIGGRLLGTLFAWVTSTIAAMQTIPAGLSRSEAVAAVATNFALASAGVALFVYLVGSIACCWLPEPVQSGTLSE